MNNPPPDNPPPENPSPGQPSAGTTLRRTAQNFALFFPSSRHNFHSSFSLGVRGILVVFFEGQNPEMYTFGLSGCLVRAPAARSGVSSPFFLETPANVHISGPRRFKQHQNSTKGPKKRLGPPPFGHARIWPKPHLPICLRDRIWPNRIWPESVFQSVDRIWPNRIWPILVF